MQTVTSNLAMTDRKNTTNFILFANYIQGRLGIYAWMISKIPSWPLLASVTSKFTIDISHLTLWSETPKITKYKLLLLLDLMTFLIDLKDCTTSPPNIAPFQPFMALLWHFPDFYGKPEKCHKWNKNVQNATIFGG